MTKPIVIMGATSGIGECALKEARGRMIKSRAFARSADELSPDEYVEPIAGDALVESDVASAIKGARAVIYALGIQERLAMLWEEETLFSDTTKVLLKAMQEEGVSRLIAVTGYGAGRSSKAMSLIERTGHRAVLGKPYADKDRQEEMIMASDLDWTIVRPVILTKGPRSGKAKIIADPSRWRNGLVSRADVGETLIRILEQGLHIREDVVVTN